MNSGELPGWMKRYYAKKHGQKQADQLSDMLKMLSEKGNRFTMHSMWNEYYSDLVTPLDDRIDIPATKVHIFYALGMGEKYRKRYLQHFAHPDLRTNSYNHEALLAVHPQEWMRELYDCLETGG